MAEPESNNDGCKSELQKTTDSFPQEKLISDRELELIMLRVQKALDSDSKSQTNKAINEITSRYEKNINDVRSHFDKTNIWILGTSAAVVLGFFALMDINTVDKIGEKLDKILPQKLEAPEIKNKIDKEISASVSSVIDAELKKFRPELENTLKQNIDVELQKMRSTISDRLYEVNNLKEEISEELTNDKGRLAEFLEENPSKSSEDILTMINDAIDKSKNDKELFVTELAKLLEERKELKEKLLKEEFYVFMGVLNNEKWKERHFDISKSNNPLLTDFYVGTKIKANNWVYMRQKEPILSKNGKKVDTGSSIGTINPGTELKIMANPIQITLSGVKKCYVRVRKVT